MIKKLLEEGGDFRGVEFGGLLTGEEFTFEEGGLGLTETEGVTTAGVFEDGGYCCVTEIGHAVKMMSLVYTVVRGGWRWREFF